MLDKHKGEQGYLLIESLLSLILLGMIALSLITVLPVLLDASTRLDKEQAIYHGLFELHDHGYMNPIFDEFDVFKHGDEWCVRYTWRDESERAICL